MTNDRGTSGAAGREDTAVGVGPADPSQGLLRRLRADDGFSDLPVVVGLVAAAGALGAAVSGLDWTTVKNTFVLFVLDSVIQAERG